MLALIYLLKTVIRNISIQNCNIPWIQEEYGSSDFGKESSISSLRTLQLGHNTISVSSTKRKLVSNV